MKQKILILSLLFFVAVASMQAQVNIGSADNPTDGAVLDLSQSGNSGLILPHVTLNGTATYQLGTSVTQALDTYPDGVGTVVFHDGTVSLATGLYVWDGDNWLAVAGTLTPYVPSAQLAYRNSASGKIDGFKSFMTYNLGADPSKSIKEQLETVTTISGSYATQAAAAAAGIPAIYGSFYQWGRTSDGHQDIWSAVSSATTGVAESSLDGNHQVLSTVAEYGKFIRNTADWIADAGSSTNFHLYPDRWDGSGSAYSASTSANLPITHTPNKVKNGNDPCPDGFKVPSRDNWTSIVDGVGPLTLIIYSFAAPDKEYLGVNRWVLVAKNDNLTTAIHGASLDGVQAQTGGVLIYPPKSPDFNPTAVAPSRSDYTDEPALFLPAAGYRNYSSGLLGNGSSNGNYWSSTAYSNASVSSAYYLNFSSSNVSSTSNTGRAYGYSVRCVAE
ncbi:hypothetical protein FACS1894176_10920 [Bacteroidia bacterium]|nr:hypothetical protein FACS1894176_10920 [Bacteroidia bacterium]